MIPHLTMAGWYAVVGTALMVVAPAFKPTWPPALLGFICLLCAGAHTVGAIS